MPRAKQLNEVELFYLLENFNKIPLDELSQKLNRTQSFLQKTYEKNKSVPSPPPELSPVTGQPKNTDARKAGELMARRKDENGNSVGIVMMTEAASFVADDIRKTPYVQSQKLKNTIHRIK